MGLFDFFFRKPEPIRDAAALADFIDGNAAFVTQKGLYEYSRVRAGHYAKVLLKEETFQQAIEASRWRAYPIGLAMIAEVVDSLLDDWLGKLQPHHDKWAAAKQSSFSDYVIARSDDVAEDLLSVTDARAQRTSHTTAKKMYQRMRDSAKKNVVEAIPELSRLIERHLAAAPQQPTATA